jgi:hypothetical protein
MILTDKNKTLVSIDHIAYISKSGKGLLIGFNLRREDIRVDYKEYSELEDDIYRIDSILK